MAKVLQSGNLNTIGNNGQFESDRSTWGFGDTADNVAIRSGAFQTAGLYSALLTKNTFSNLYLLPIKWVGTIGKKYVVRAKVRVPSATPIGAGAALITFRATLSNFHFGLTTIDYIDKTVTAATDTWVDIEIGLEATSDPFAPEYGIGLCLDGVGTNGGKIHVDQFEVYEYIEEDIDLTCDVEIDPDDTDVTDETAEGANNGSIDVSATGTPTLQYSKDGSTWQLASLFTGLGTGVYIMRVRRQELTTCLHEYPFALNHASVTHDFTAIVTNESVSGLHDGSISINVTGTGGPFEFSIDGGVTWNAGNNFSNLAPGTYYVAVRNADGNSVVKVITVVAGAIEIDKIYHSDNPITLGKTASAGWEVATNYRLYLDVRVEDIADSGNYNSKLKMELPPDSNGQVVFYLPEAFRDAFTFTPPDLNHSEIIRLTDRIKRFKNFTGELENLQVTPAELEESVANLVLWGGIDKFHFPGLNYFTSYLPVKKKFLTWAPVEKYVDRLQEDYLSFYVYGNFTTLKLRLKVYFDDDTNTTTVTKTLAGTKYTQLFQIPAGPNNSGALLVNPAKNVLKYELVLLDQSDAVITETRTYHIQQVKHPLSRYFMFLNSLGGFEVLRFYGQQVSKTHFTREVVQRFLPHNYNPLDGEFAVNSISRQKQRNISSGFVKNSFAAEWHEYLEDFMGSPIIFDVTEGSRYPIVVTAGEHTTEDQNYERFIRVDAREAYDNIHFTPSKI